MISLLCSLVCVTELCEQKMKHIAINSKTLLTTLSIPYLAMLIVLTLPEKHAKGKLCNWLSNRLTRVCFDNMGGRM